MHAVHRCDKKDPSAALGMTKREDGLSHITSHPAAGANLRPFGAPPSKGRREKSLPVLPRSPYRHFERSEKSSLHTGETESVRQAPERFSEQPHACRTHLRQERSLGCARDDEARGRAIAHSFSTEHVEGCPFGADLSSAFGAPLLQGATQRSCKSATPKHHFLPDGKVNEMRIPLSQHP